jgi:hypothetical protein
MDGWRGGVRDRKTRPPVFTHHPLPPSLPPTQQFDETLKKVRSLTAMGFARSAAVGALAAAGGDAAAATDLLLAGAAGKGVGIK